MDFHGYAKHHLGLQRIEKPSKDGESGTSDDGAYLKPLTVEEQQANKTAMLKRSKDLIFMSPMLSGFAMKDKVWRTSLPSIVALVSTVLMYRQSNSMLMTSNPSSGMMKPTIIWSIQKARRTSY